MKNDESKKFLAYFHFLILNCSNLAVRAPAGALALHAQIFLDYFNILIINWPLLRALKILNQKHFTYVFMFHS